MCFHSQLSKTTKEIEKHFNSKMATQDFNPPSIFNGFSHPATPVITNENPNFIELFHWGLIPFWAKDTSIRKHTLNARIETIEEKASYKNYINNRCLVILDSFFEWQWQDHKGNKKIKYRLFLPENEIFTLAGLWSEWRDKITGRKLRTYTILTTKANELMTQIHNSKKRMPMIVSNEKEWLLGAKMEIKNDELLAEQL